MGTTSSCCLRGNSDADERIPRSRAKRGGIEGQMITSERQHGYAFRKADVVGGLLDETRATQVQADLKKVLGMSQIPAK